MMGLVLKDFYTIMRKAKYLLLMSAICAVVPTLNLFSYAIFFAAMLPITALSYDEQSRWDKLAQMMPYSKWDLVISKYLEGYLFVGGMAVLILISRLVISLFHMKVYLTQDDILLVILVVCATVSMQAFILPLIFRVGVEKGRVIWILVMVLCMTSISGVVMDWQQTGILTQIIPNSMLGLAKIAAMFTILLNVLSILISGKIYRVSRS